MSLPRLVSLLWACCTLVLCRSYVIQPGVWRFRGHPIAYEEAGVTIADDKYAADKSVETSATSDESPVLLLNGFGVGSFHQHRLIHEILGSDDKVDRPIYCLDYLGQGSSWPDNCQDGQGETEEGLCYCGSTWVAQICDFIEQVILPRHNGRPVHLVGNSVGGHLATFVAAARPDLVASLGLLNATPVWGLNLPGWNGQLPAPWLPKQVGRYLFDRIRDLTTIEAYLGAAYGNTEAFDNELMQQIRACTDGLGGHAAFASILWSPPINIRSPRSPTTTISSFYEALRVVDCDVVLLFGAVDPWCKPAFAKRMLEQLSLRESAVTARYVEIDQVGHCPNHESPKSTAFLLDAWWKDRQLPTGAVCMQETWGATTLQERRMEEIPLSLVDRLAVTFV
jgi:pimeloyl-ACP methyl ester carboxylesterase